MSGPSGKEILTLLLGVTVAGLITTVVVMKIRAKRAPTGKPGDYLYYVTSAGQGNDGKPRYLAAVSPNFGDVLEWLTLGRGYVSEEEARGAALAAIAERDGTPFEFIA